MARRKQKNKVQPQAIPRLLDCAQVSEFLGFAKKTVWSMAASGEIPSFCIGRHYRFRREELESWLEKRRVKQRIPDGRILPRT